MNLRINGKPVSHHGLSTILALLQAKGIEPAHVVVELNETIVPRDRFGETTITEGDRLEVLRFVGGG